MLQYILIFFILLVLISFSSKKSIWIPSSNNRVGESVCLLLLCCMSAFKASTVGNDTHEVLCFIAKCVWGVEIKIFGFSSSALCE